MKASKVAAVVSALLATDSKPSEASILAAILAADKKGKDEGGLGPVENEKLKTGKDKAKDEFPPKDKAEDEDKDDEKAKDADPDMDAEDEDKDDEKAKDADVQPKVSEKGNAGKEPGMDKKANDAAIKVALDARDALHAARREVETVLGVVAYDSAAQVYEAALKKLGVATDGVDASAFPVLFKLARDKADAQAPVMASDAAVVKGMAGAIKGYDRLK